MKKTAIIVGVLVLLVVGVVAIWQHFYPSGTWRYKMTVTVETPEGLKTGSAVREIYAYREPKVFPEQPSGHASVVKGEAVAVNLGKRGVLFAIMKSKYLGEDYGYMIVFKAFPFAGGGLTKAGILHYRSLKSGKAVLTPKQYPMLVKFGDMPDPTSVQRVDPTDLAKSFGAGVRLKEITVEMTDEPVTWEADKYLPSFGEETGFWKWFRGLSYGDPRRLGPYNFAIGENHG